MSQPQPPRTIAILGATGGTGRQLVNQALAAGYHVIALVRDPAKLDLAHERLRIEVADVTDAESLAPLLEDADAVLSALGSTGGDVCEQAMRAVLDASASDARIIAVSAQPVARRDDGPAWWCRLFLLPVIRRIYRAEYADLARMEEVLHASAVVWSVLRPPYLTDAPAVGTRRLREEASPPRSLSMSRADLALTMLHILDEPSTYRRVLGVGSP
ncbi:NAD(P)H-binding protein [Pseudonocardia sp. NPDC046786]|uniref:NAD(P)-dependent oxidoreductase n=1 Tax=Pseudonocardia sp. NPDC046786 TaxID=3155471 RepID=UPI0033DC4C26